MGRKRDDIEGITNDIKESLFNISKSELIDWIMELNFHDMSDEDLLEDYQNFYGDLED